MADQSGIKAARIAARTVVTQENMGEFVANGGKFAEKPAAEAKPTETKTEPAAKPAEGEAVEAKPAEGAPAAPKGEKPEWLKDLQRERERRKQAENEAREAAAGVQALRERLARLEAGAAPPAAADDLKPRRDMFATDAEYQEAMVEYKVEEKIREREAEELVNEQKKVAAEVEETWQANLETFRDANDGFQEQVNACRLQFPRELLGEIPLLDNGPAVMYYLTNPENADEANRLIEKFRKDLKIRRFPSAGIRALGRIDDKVRPTTGESSKPAAGKPNGQSRDGTAIEISKAPAPTEPLRGAATVNRAPEKMSPAEYREWRRAELNKRSH
jgi:hypothetical protein